MFDEKQHDLVDMPATDAGLANAEALAAAPEVNGTAPDPVKVDGAPAGDHRRYADAGRKGAERVHQLIQLGRQYEQEHGLKRGRQRLRQLIEEGKRFELEHGLREGRKPRRKRLSRLGREQLVVNLLETLQRMVKPAFREQLRRAVEALSTPTN
jgi:hypothetical protein